MARKENGKEDLRGRGKGWEEAIQHKVFARFVKERGWRCDPNAPIPIPEFGNPGPNRKAASIYADFLVDKGTYYEVVECKEGNPDLLT